MQRFGVVLRCGLGPQPSKGLRRENRLGRGWVQRPLSVHVSGWLRVPDTEKREVDLSVGFFNDGEKKSHHKSQLLMCQQYLKI